MNLVKALICGITVVGICLYGLSWLTMAAALRRFGLAPSDVGYDFSALVVRSGSLAFVVVCLVVIPLHASDAWNWKRRAHAGDLRWLHRFLFASQVLSFGLVIAVSSQIAGSPFKLPMTEPGRAFVIVAVALLVSFVFTSWALRAFGYSARTGRGAALTSDHSDSARIAMLAAWALLLIGASYSLGDLIGKRIMGGKEIDAIVVQFPRVDVLYSLNGGGQDCLSRRSSILLGVSDGAAYIFDPSTESVIRVATPDLIVNSANGTQSASAEIQEPLDLRIQCWRSSQDRDPSGGDG